MELYYNLYSPFHLGLSVLGTLVTIMASPHYCLSVLACFMMIFLARWQRWFAIAYLWFCLPCPFARLSFKRGY